MVAEAFKVVTFYVMIDKWFKQYAALMREFTPDRAVVREHVKAFLTASDYALFAAISGEKMLGTVRFQRKIQTDAVEFLVDDMFVPPSCRGRGIGRALMEYGHRIAATEWGATRGTLTCNKGRTDARRLYRKLGYTPRGECWFVKDML